MKVYMIMGATVLLALFSCNRKENEQIAGKGGAALLQAIPKHHAVSKNIIRGKIYLAYNTQDIPSKYDDSVDCVLIDGVPTATFAGLKAGKYYLLGTGYDTSISQDVKGGTPYTISQETTLTVDVPVTETH